MNSNAWTRLGGVALVVLGAILGWWLLGPAAAGEDAFFSPRLFVLVPVCLVFGLFFAVAGDRVPYRDVERQTLTQAGWLLMAAVAVLTLLAFGWTEGWFGASR